MVRLEVPLREVEARTYPPLPGCLSPLNQRAITFTKIILFIEISSLKIFLIKLIKIVDIERIQKNKILIVEIFQKLVN